MGALSQSPKVVGLEKTRKSFTQLHVRGGNLIVTSLMRMLGMIVLKAEL